MKKALFIFVLSLTCLNVQAQHIRCLTDQKLAERIAEDPAIADQVFSSHLNGNVTESQQAVVTIPVVVHVVYRTTFQNISQTQILSQITALNKDFRKTNPDTSIIPAAFQAAAADSEIEFCLAKRDPNDQLTDGITRTSTTINNIGTTNSYYSTSAGGKDAWPRDKYLNIWVLDIDGGSTLGFAYLPGSAGPSNDGVVIDYRYFGTTGTVSYPFNKGRTGTHEIGHFLNLQHIWGWGNCGDDFVSDTPIQQTANYGCPTAPLHPNACGSTNPNGDMFVNYMDYVDDRCMVMFTTGQKARMQAALNSSAGQRSSLKTSTGCVPVSGISERISQPAFNIHPNPSSETVFISLEKRTTSPLEVFDLSGKLIRTFVPESRTVEMNVSDLAPGIYLIKLENSTQRLVITR